MKVISVDMESNPVYLFVCESDHIGQREGLILGG